MKNYMRLISAFLALLLMCSALPLIGAEDAGTGPDGTYPVARCFASAKLYESYFSGVYGEYIVADNVIYDETGKELPIIDGESLDYVDYSEFGEIISVSYTDFIVANEDETFSSYSLKDGSKTGDYTTLISVTGVDILADESSVYYFGADGRVALDGNLETRAIGDGLISVIDWAGQDVELPEDVTEDSSELYDIILEALSSLDMSLVTSKVINTRTGESIAFENGVLPVSYDPEMELFICMKLDTEDLNKSEILSFDKQGALMNNGKMATVGRLNDAYLTTVSSDFSKSYVIGNDGEVKLEFENDIGVLGVFMMLFVTPESLTLYMPRAVCGDFAVVTVASTDSESVGTYIYNLESGEITGKYLYCEVINQSYTFLVEEDGNGKIIGPDGTLTDSPYSGYITDYYDGEVVVALDETYCFAALLDSELCEIELPREYDVVEPFKGFAIGTTYSYSDGEIVDSHVELISLDGRTLIDGDYTGGYIIGEMTNGSVVVAFYDEETGHKDYYLVEYSTMPFLDVKPVDWHYPYVEYALDTGLMIGMSDTEFAPNAQMTRAQLVTILWRVDGSPASTAVADFSDVADDAWYAEPVAWAAENGVVLGYENGTFCPDVPLTREQLALILFRYTEQKGGDVSAGGELDSFTNDVNDVHNWAYDAVDWAVCKKLLQGNRADGKVGLDPQRCATRAEVATIMKRYLEL